MKHVHTWLVPALALVVVALGVHAAPAAAQTAPVPVLDVKSSVGDSVLHVNDDGGVLATGEFGSGTGVIPTEGAGTRLMWYPEMAAFRAGLVTGSEWDDGNIGEASVGLGYNTTASGNRSFAAGFSTKASGIGSVALGQFTEASGNYGSVAIGWGATASGYHAAALGNHTTAQAFASLVIGRYNTVTGQGTYWNSTDPLFVAGNGADATSPSDAMVLYKNGNLTIAGTLTESSDIRLKEEVEPVEGTLDRVLRLTPIRYRFREGTGHPRDRQLGFSAQEVEPLFPELVTRDARGYLSVAYADFSAVLVRAVQEQQQELDALREENAGLEERVSRLEVERAEMRARLERLEAALERVRPTGRDER